MLTLRSIHYICVLIYTYPLVTLFLFMIFMEPITVIKKIYKTPREEIRLIYYAESFILISVILYSHFLFHFIPLKVKIKYSTRILSNLSP